MRLIPLVFLLLVGACEGKEDVGTVAKLLPEEAKVPSCPSLVVADSAHSQGDGYGDTFEFEASRDCIDEWARDLGHPANRRGILLSKEDADGHLIAGRPIEDDNRMRVMWSHSMPLNGVIYSELEVPR